MANVQEVMEGYKRSLKLIEKYDSRAYKNILRSFKFIGPYQTEKLWKTVEEAQNDKNFSVTIARQDLFKLGITQSVEFEVKNDSIWLEFGVESDYYDRETSYLIKPVTKSDLEKGEKIEFFSRVVENSLGDKDTTYYLQKGKNNKYEVLIEKGSDYTENLTQRTKHLKENILE